MYYYNFTARPGKSTATFEGTSTSFNTEGLKPKRHSGNVGLSLNMQSEHVGVVAEYNFEMKKKFTGHSGSVKLRYLF